jgi:16S rRNA (cytidine1402-2'-O)-methyltransferase
MEKSLTASYGAALLAAREAAAMQDYPAGTLYMVATPIGNLADISLRALHVLQLVDVIACEDTRHSQSLLRAYGLERAASQLMALHQHNEAQASNDVLALLGAGQRVAYMSDAGTPAVSDPGARLVQAAAAVGARVSPIPGASSVTTALSVAGVVGANGQDCGFVFAGFLSSKAGERATEVGQLALESRPVVLLEAPHRIEALAQSLGVLGDRAVTVGRELTKLFEEVVTLKCSELEAWLTQDPQRQKGEFSAYIHPHTSAPDSEELSGLKVLKLLMSELPLKTAVKLAHDMTGQPKNDLYRVALSLKKE